MGEGVLPIPDKLLRNVLNLEFIEMTELLPETWLWDEEESSKNVLMFPKKKASPTTDILQWFQCFSAMVGVLSRIFPQAVPELMVYQATMMKCSKDFDGIAWVQYDRAFRRQAPQTKSLSWSNLNPTLYSICFAGKARRNTTCVHC